jgi:RNA polymerase sigma-54 factor
MATRFLLKAETRLSPSLVLGARLLHLPARELEEAIRRELEENPALELVNERGWDGPLSGGSLVATPGRSGGRPIDGLQIAARASALESLESEVRIQASYPARDAALVLLERLDPRGFIEATPEELAAELGAPVKVIQLGLEVLHAIEPAGIGARDLHECLLIQCARLEADGVTQPLVRRILTDAWDDFYHQRWDMVAGRLGLTLDAMELARQFMARNFYPYPLELLETRPLGNQLLTWADLIISRELHDGSASYHVRIPAAENWELRVCDSFLLSRSGAQPTLLPDAERSWIRVYVDRARLFSAALHQRWDTLRRVGEYLVRQQRDFLEAGPDRLRPLSRRQLARDLDLHESTVSRAVRDKTVRLPSGRMIPLSDFFEPSLAIKQTIEQLLASADGPMSDREIAADLRSKGLELARRTVAKYRSQLSAPAGGGRKRECASSQSSRS